MKKIFLLLSLSLLISSCTSLRPVVSSNDLSEPSIPSSETRISSSEPIPSSEVGSLPSSEISYTSSSSLSEEKETHEISSLYFKYVEHHAYKSNNINYLMVSFECPIDIYKIDYSFDIYKNNGDLVGNGYEGELETKINETGFSFVYPGLDDNAFYNIGYINFNSLTGESYEEAPLESYEHAVRIHNDEEVETLTVKSGDKIEEPIIDSLNNNIKLDGWYLDNNNQKKFNFVDYTIYQDIDLYPYYTLDEEAFDQDVRTTFLTSNMVIYATSYNQSFIMRTDEYTVTGSGVVIDKQGNYTYVITNNHVTSKINGCNYVSYNVKDVYNSVYSATLVYADPSYDLSLLRVRIRTKKNYYIPTFASSNPEAGDNVAAVGQPNGEANTITIGEVTTYKKVTIDDDSPSDVRFDVITHSARTDHGSSGGALLDTNLKLVGINYAGATRVEDDSFVESYAIPIEKVKEFLTVAYENI